ncbi:MAG: hypothetical protein V1918_05150 [Planctomycetota bacterium]
MRVGVVGRVMGCLERAARIEAADLEILQRRMERVRTLGAEYAGISLSESLKADA